MPGTVLPFPVQNIREQALIKSLVLSALVLASCAPGFAAAQAAQPATSQQQTIVRAGSQPSSQGPAQYFTGDVRVDPVFPASADVPYSAAYVTFEPGARSAWHTHPAGQRLVVTAGVGRTGTWGGPVVEIKAGDAVWCPPGVKHWHGAAPGSAMTHLALTGQKDGQNVVWLEKVSDEQYGRATSETLSARQQAIAPIAAFAAAGNIANLGAALNQGLDAGLTVSEVREVLVQVYAYAGFPRSLNALNELMKVLDARKQRGIQDAQGRGPSRPIPKGDALLAAGTANQTRLVGAPVSGPVYEFAPAIDEYLKAHLFGAIFERDVLDWQARELATVSMLSALPGAEAQLQSHMRVSMNVGLTTGQLRQLVQVLGDRVGTEHAGRAREALARQLAAAGRG